MTGNMIGRIFNNRYKITERIGIGGMAEVYRAQDTVLGRMVAVKVMLPQYAADPSFTQRFRQEAASAANLQSPYIVNVYDWGQDSGTYYIVMEYVRGSDLKTAIKERGAINQRKVAEIGSQVCQALSVAHNLDIIHRDIKPQNIMVQADGNVKVMDFGIARAKNSVKTQTSSVLGTAHYVSPEQAQGKELTYASDIYSLGIVLYEAATGKLPFDGPDAVSVAMKQVQEQPVPPSQVNPAIDAALEDIIMKALDKTPDNRFATARDMKNALNDYLSGRPVNLGGFTSASTVVMGGVPNVPPIAGDGTQVMPAGMGNGMQQGVNHGTTTYHGVEGEPKKKGRVGLIVALIVAVVAVAAIAFGLTQCSGSGTPVPDVVNMEQTQAEETIRAAGFEVGTVSTAKSNSVEEGHVISQDPSGGSKREEGSKINLVVSGGEDTVTLPDVTGQTEDAARRSLEQCGLTVSTRTEHSTDVDEGHVISMSPEAGSQVSKTTTITLTISMGAETIDVPNVTGMSESNARSALQEAGFQVSSSTQESSTVEKGVVISYSPSGKADKGSTISIVVSSGTSEVDVPNVTGDSLSSAQSQLSGAGFTYNVVYAYSSSVTEGYVISYSPTGKARPGTNITITVSNGPEQQQPSSSSTPSTPDEGNGSSEEETGGNGSTPATPSAESGALPFL